MGGLDPPIQLHITSPRLTRLNYFYIVYLIPDAGKMKNFLFSLLILLHLRTPPAKPDPAENALPGWNAFQFGMSPQAVLAIPDYDVSGYIPVTPSGEDLGAITSKRDAALYGHPYRLTLFFTRHQKPDDRALIPAQTLGEIALQDENPSPRDDCQNAFLLLLARLEKNYGKFGPFYPERKESPQDRLRMSVEWKNSGALSRYQLITVFLPLETAYVWNARRYFGTRYVDLAAIWSAQRAGDPSTCMTVLDFKRP
jgi:hypothetical protein